jgi:hypothetical protein
MAKRVDQEKKPEEPKGNFPKAHKEVNYIYVGPDSSESRRKSVTTSAFPITFDRSDDMHFVPKPVWYLVIVSPIVKDVKLNRVLVDVDSSLNIRFLNTFD